MVMLSTTLASELENNMSLVDNESDAINHLAASLETFFYDMSVGGVPANAGTLAGAGAAMKAAMSGMSATNAGATAIQAGITAFWGVVASSAATIWTTVPPCTGATPPTTLATIAATLNGVFSANTSGELNKSAAMNAIATAIYTANLGGICIIPSPGAPTPIL